MFKESLFHRIGLQFFAADTGSGTGSENNTGSEGADPGSENNSGAKSFTQEEVNRMMANEKRSARSALLKELGYEVKDGKYADTVTTIKGILDAGKTQQQLDQEARTTAETNLAAERSKNNSLQARVDVMTAGVKPEFVSDAISMLMPQVTEEKTLSKLLEEYKTKYPAWFGDSSTGSKGTGSPNNPPKGTGSKDTGEFGKRLAQVNKPGNKSSYFKH